MEEDHKKKQEEALEKRLSGELPTIDIAGQIFYVDIGMDCLRPKNIFATLGIQFSEIRKHYSWLEENYVFTYNPKTYESQEVDYTNIHSIPENLLLVELPSKRKLDPVGYARINGYEVNPFVKEVGIRSHFKAKIRPLKAHLLEQQRLDKEFRKSMQEEDRPSRKRRKGRSL
ncbi:hypothetical protein SAMN04487891_102384 [Flagellimonas taeanensis]|uniref:Uncharacterized protein n=1 Tax=Flagellimonas taeanensis TaxID=1005926 RepID=A0A1M6SBR4_9FLAO|nr:hypothetical protein [Allomuricauda taeanensis]SFB79669.1 hypothetical protein SAMN04487891_102384 [Allomuricauda taeanensis]SHK41967.1 hypothetical protein SAMN05216293_1063 [Allomuricauda taeanensis]